MHIVLHRHATNFATRDEQAIGLRLLGLDVRRRAAERVARLLLR
jgi:hypothetical protein